MASRSPRWLAWLGAALLGGVVACAVSRSSRAPWPPRSGEGSSPLRSVPPASSLEGGAPSALAPFSEERAFALLQRLVDLPRHQGAPERARSLAFLAEELGHSTERVERQDFEAVEAPTGQRYGLTNVIGRQRPEAQRRILVGSHWDSRAWAEEDPDTSRRQEPIPGANDGGSGVAVLLELASVTQGLSRLGLDYVLFDGEEFGRPGTSDYCQGSRWFARHLSSFYPGAPPEAVLVLDMVGDADQAFFYEGSSLASSPELTHEVWGAARTLGFPQFQERPRYTILDDHSPFLDRGIPALLLIDYDYPYWHTHADTLDKVRPQSLGRVGAVLLEFLRQRERRAP